jgi:hypothetical protein
MNFKIAAEKISEELGEKIIKQIGSGDFGWVFLLESGRVLKITSDVNEIIIAKKLVKNKNLFKYILNYYNVGEIEDELYFILMDYIQPVNEWEKKVINFAFKKLLQFSKSFYNSVFSNDFIFLIKDRFVKKEKNLFFLGKYNNSEIKEMKEFALSLIPQIRNIAKELKLHSIKQCDFHGGNLGWNEDHELVLFDITKPKDPYGISIPKPKLKKYALYEYRETPPDVVDVRIEEIADHLGEEIVEYLGGGVFGYAYKTKSGKVIKITSDETEADLAYKLTKRKSWMKSIINFYNVGRMKAKNSDPSKLDTYNWYILMDYVETPDKDEKDAIECYINAMKNNPNYYKDLLDREEILDHINFMYGEESYLYNKAKIDGRDPNKIKQIAIELYPKVLKMAKELKLHGVKETDFHSDNVGWDVKHENLVIYDIGNIQKSTKPKSGKFKELITTEKFITKFSLWTHLK